MNNEFNTGDILLLDNTNNTSIFAQLIKFLTHSKYSHCGMIIKDPKFTVKPMTGLYFLESGIESFNDAENNRKKCGVQLVSLTEMIKNYPGDIYWRKLNCTRDSKFYDNLAQAHNDVHNLPYDIDPIDWLKGYLKIKHNSQHKDRFWCSALLAYLYTKLDFLKSDTDWSIISPQEFSFKDNTLDFINCTLDNEIFIDKKKY